MKIYREEKIETTRLTKISFSTTDLAKLNNAIVEKLNSGEEFYELDEDDFKQILEGDGRAYEIHGCSKYRLTKVNGKMVWNTFNDEFTLSAFIDDYLSELFDSGDFDDIDEDTVSTVITIDEE